MCLKAHCATIKVHLQFRMVVARLSQPGHCVHKNHGLWVVTEAEGFLNDHIRAITTQEPTVKFGQFCYYYCSCKRFIYKG